MAIYCDKITLKVGNSSVENIESLRWNIIPADNVRPQLVMNQVEPVAWHQGHKWIEGELVVKSEAHSVLNSMLGNASDNVTIEMIDNTQSTWTVSFTGFVFKTRGQEHRHGEDSTETWTFIAKTVTVTPPI